MSQPFNSFLLPIGVARERKERKKMPRQLKSLAFNRLVLLSFLIGVESHRVTNLGPPLYSHQGLPGDLLSQRPSTAGSIEHPALDIGSVEGSCVFLSLHCVSFVVVDCLQTTSLRNSIRVGCNF